MDRWLPDLASPGDEDRFPVHPVDGCFRISPTDVSAFVSMEQCPRVLRLKLHEANKTGGPSVYAQAGVQPQRIAPLRSRKGREFEQRIGGLLTAEQLTPARGPAARTDPRLLDVARSLPPGQQAVLLQAQMVATIGAWRVSGIADLVRLERNAAGALSATIVDVKASLLPMVDHRMQVAFYERMLEAEFSAAGIALAAVRLGIVYRGPAPEDAAIDEATRERLRRDRAAAEREFGLTEGYLEVIANPESYREDIDRFVFAPDSRAVEAIATRYDDLAFHIAAKCNGCTYGEICVRWMREHDDLSQVPFITADQKAALRAEGFTTTAQVAELLEPLPGPRNHGPHRQRMQPAPAHRDAVERLNARRSVGPDLDSLVFRAKRIQADRAPSGERAAPRSGPGGTPSTLPLSNADRHPNLVTIYLDAQTDPLTDRVWALGALVTAADGGVVAPDRVRHVVRIAQRPPETSDIEKALLLDWIGATLRAVAELAAPDAAGGRTAPIHLVVWSERERNALLGALGRHTESARGSTPLAAFLDPAATSESPLVTVLIDEVKRTREYPLLCQTVQSVASILRFDWGAYPAKFRERLFDARGRVETNGGEEWVQVRPRFSSDVPAEYAYAAWGDLPDPEGDDPYRRYRGVTMADLEGLAEKRLDALRHIAGSLRPDPTMEKLPFPIPSLHELLPPVESFARALLDFLVIERLAEVASWKQRRCAPPEERVLAGSTLLASYHADDQDPEVRDLNAAHRAWADRRTARMDAMRAIDPAARWDQLEDDPDDPEPPWIAGMEVRLRLEPGQTHVSLDDMLSLTELRQHERVVTLPRWRSTFVTPDGEELVFAQNANNLLRGTRADIVSLPQPADPAAEPVVVLRMAGRSGRANPPYTFGWFPNAFADGETYTLDADPNSPSDATVKATLDGIIGRPGKEPEPNTLVALLAPDEAPRTEPMWPQVAEAGQKRFMAGLDAMRGVDGFYAIGDPARRYIADFGESDLFLVQGPPGSGKSSTSAFALLARMQGAMDAKRNARILVSANTHAAVNVLLGWLAKAVAQLRRWQHLEPDLFARYFDSRLLDVPVYRLGSHDGSPAGVVVLPREGERDKGAPKAIDLIGGPQAAPYLFAGGTPGAVHDLVKGRKLSIARNQPFTLLVLDEASRMGLPEAVMAAKALAPAGKVIVVGDHRQMQPIRAREWDSDPRRVFEAYAPFESAYDALRSRGVERIPLQESFRIHRDVAEFLRYQIYSRDNIRYHSNRTDLLRAAADDHPFVGAALDPDYPMVLVRHGERDSQLRNPFEAKLVGLLAQGLLRREKDVRDGMGVVVPHRAQRAAIGAMLQQMVNPDQARLAMEAVDTVERFQGGERDAIIVSATESDPVYLLNSGGFLYEPTRLTVALSRARHKLVLVAAGSVFDLFSPEDELYENIELWRSIPRRWCTTPLWRDDIDGVPVEVFGNAPAFPPAWLA